MAYKTFNEWMAEIHPDQYDENLHKKINKGLKATAVGLSLGAAGLAGYKYFNPPKAAPPAVVKDIDAELLSQGISPEQLDSLSPELKEILARMPKGVKAYTPKKSDFSRHEDKPLTDDEQEMGREYLRRHEEPMFVPPSGPERDAYLNKVRKDLGWKK